MFRYRINQWVRLQDEPGEFVIIGIKTACPQEPANNRYLVMDTGMGLMRVVTEYNILEGADKRGDLYRHLGRETQ